MSAAARKMGANAVICIDLDYEVIREGMLMVSASGTAVVLSEWSACMHERNLWSRNCGIRE
jgi:uncharacterized protein YbjQ (UPF0145 family)